VVSPFSEFMDRSPGLNFPDQTSGIVIADALMVLVMGFHCWLVPFLSAVPCGGGDRPGFNAPKHP
jgi:hypothetical protein